jgi:hypothetical protein
LAAYIHITAHHAHKNTSSQSKNTSPFLEATCKISFLLPGIEEGLVLYGWTGFVVVSAVGFGKNNEEQTGTNFFWGLFTFEHDTLVVLFRNPAFSCFFFCSTQPVFAKFFTVSHIRVLHGTVDILYKTFMDFFSNTYT